MITRLSADLRLAFPNLKGFSPRNLQYMRAFAEAYPDEHFVQQVVAQIPWGHNVRLLDAVKDTEERTWYAHQTIRYGWSRAVLLQQIESSLYRRQGQAVTNFHGTLPAPQSDTSTCSSTMSACAATWLSTPRWLISSRRSRDPAKW